VLRQRSHGVMGLLGVYCRDVAACPVRVLPQQRARCDAARSVATASMTVIRQGFTNAGNRSNPMKYGHRESGGVKCHLA
jgi:hypothetical protein